MQQCIPHRKASASTVWQIFGVKTGIGIRRLLKEDLQIAMTDWKMIISATSITVNAICNF